MAELSHRLIGFIVVNDGTKIDIISGKTKKAIVFLQNMPSREVLTAYVLIAG